MRRSLVFITFSIIFSLQIFAQNDFFDATIKTSDGKSIDGFVKIEKGYCPDVLIFKTKTDNQEQTYKPSDIVNFSCGGRLYVSSFAEIKQDKEFIGKQVFLLLEISGTKSLYSYITHEQHNFYIKKDETFILLEKDNDKFKNQLSDYLGDCKTELKNTINSTTYELNSLQKLFTEYHTCLDNLYSVTTMENDIRTRFYVNGGGVRTMMVVWGSNFEDSQYFLDMEIVPDYTATGYISMTWDLEEGFDNIAFYNALGYVYSGFSDENDRFHLIMNTNYLKYYYGLKFKPCCRKFAPTLSLGLSEGFLVSIVNYRKDVYNETLAIKEDALKKTEIGAWVNLGFDFGRFTTNFGIERSSGFSKYVTFAARYNRIYATIGFKIFEL